MQNKFFYVHMLNEDDQYLHIAKRFVPITLCGIEADYAAVGEDALDGIGVQVCPKCQQIENQYSNNG